ncbi:hypothetical protein LZ31DRAFT_290814 [Colletotrichum somersetense]|nr:hypothetical protein LZ31DRAFT_290814 [Colletotrichum somersetense]
MQGRHHRYHDCQPTTQRPPSSLMTIRMYRRPDIATTRFISCCAPDQSNRQGHTHIAASAGSPSSRRHGLGTDESFHRLPPFSLSTTNGPRAFGSLSNGVSTNPGRPCRIGAGVCRRRLRVMVMREPRLARGHADLTYYTSPAVRVRPSRFIARPTLGGLVLRQCVAGIFQRHRTYERTCMYAMKSGTKLHKCKVRQVRLQ